MRPQSHAKSLVPRSGEKRSNALPRELGHVALAGLALHESGILPHAPRDAQGRQSPRPTIVCQGVEARIGCRIVGLSRLSQECRRRGEQHEQIEVRQQPIEELRAPQLGPNDRVECGAAQGGREVVIEGAGRVNDSADRRPSLLPRSDQEMREAGSRR